MVQKCLVQGRTGMAVHFHVVRLQGRQEHTAALPGLLLPLAHSIATLQSLTFCLALMWLTCAC